MSKLNCMLFSVAKRFNMSSVNLLTGVDMELLEAINNKWQDMVDERGLDFEFDANEMVLF